MFFFSCIKEAVITTKLNQLNFDLSIDFREPYEDLIGHNIHPYPCKFPPNVPRDIILKYGKNGDVVFDPFVGSGTTLVEAMLLGFNSIGVDINPIACLLSKVKTTPFNDDYFYKSNDYINNFILSFNKSKKQDLKNVALFNYSSVDHWFQKNVIKELSFIKNWIRDIKEKDIRDMFLVAMSAIIVRVSNQESDTRYAAVNKNIQDGYTIGAFIKKSKELIISLNNLWERMPDKNVKASVFLADARGMNGIPDNKANIVITSPPYANTYDYYLYHKHRKCWLDMDVLHAQYNEIGSRREFSSLKESPEKWEDDMKKCMKEISRITKKGGKVFIIIGDSVINKNLIKNNELLKKIGESSRLACLNIVSTPLSKHSKVFNPLFQSKNKEEHLIYFEKY